MSFDIASAPIIRWTALSHALTNLGGIGAFLFFRPL